MSNTPLESSSVDVAVFCLSLMGTNYSSYIKEAHRVLRPSGWLLIAEVKSRFDPNNGGADPKDFVKAVSDLGFSSSLKDFSNKMFILLHFKKKAEPISLRAVASGKPKLPGSDSRFNLVQFFAASGRYQTGRASGLLFCGWLLIAEVKSRFDPNNGGADPKDFVKAVSDLGFSSSLKDFSNKMFILLHFKKKAEPISLRAVASWRPKLPGSDSRFNLVRSFAASGRYQTGRASGLLVWCVVSCSGLG
ncbi:hypothetical protein F2Q69_00016190 [Brassica cretica]|uniref:Ribosomal RNA-processing protein 8 n=1 Tax=Brassica cretica TaxID=69181 RepID=A0A8S9R7F2_BRACR|nr:hypothetical protein F2Q69_00016190 [Brassica cretica]